VGWQPNLNTIRRLTYRGQAVCRRRAGAIGPGGQAQFSASLALQAAEDRFGTLHEWVRGHLADNLSLSILANRAGMSERSFSRHYAEVTGQTPARAIERLRLEAAQNLLLESRLPVKRIAQRCGFG
jgi:transcriptional regulator GlxA family with amidase domain